MKNWDICEISLIMARVNELDESREAVKELLNEAEQWARNHVIKLLKLNSGMEETAAHRFYWAMDFIDEKDQKKFIK